MAIGKYHIHSYLIINKEITYKSNYDYIEEHIINIKSF